MKKLTVCVAAFVLAIALLSCTTPKKTEWLTPAEVKALYPNLGAGMKAMQDGKR